MGRKTILIVAIFTLLSVALLPVIAACARTAPTPAPAPPPTTAAKPAAKPSPTVAAPKPKPAPTATAKPAPPPTAVVKPGEQLPKNLIFLGAGAGKTYELSAYISEMVTKYTPMKGSIERTAGGTQSMLMIAKGDAHVAGLSPPALKIDEAKSKVAINLLFSGAGLEGSTLIGIFTKPTAGIRSVKDLKGKKVYGERPVLPWTVAVMAALLKVNGMTEKDMTYLKMGEPDPAFIDLKEGRVDAILYLAGSGTVEMGQSTGLFVVPFTPAEQKAIDDLGLGYQKTVWTKGLFGNSNDTATMLAPLIYYTYPGLSEFTVYTLVKTIYDRLPELHASQEAAKGFTLDAALGVWSFPYHPGSIRYFKEKGVWKAEHDAKQKAALEEQKRIIGK